MGEDAKMTKELENLKTTICERWKLQEVEIISPKILNW